MTALYHAYSQTVADGTATSVVRPSDWNSAHVQGQTLSGNTAGASTFTGTNIVLQGGNNVTLSAATAAGAATIVISGANTVAQSVQTQAAGNIAGTNTTLALTNLSGTLSVNTNGVALSLSAGAGGPGGGVQIAAGGSTVSDSTVVFSNANGVSFGLNGSTMTASVIANNTYDGWAPYADLEMVAGQQGQGTLYMEPEHSPYYFQDRVGIPIAYSNATNSTGSVTLSYWMGFYTQSGSTLSLSASTSVSTALTFSGTVGSYSLHSGMRLLTIPWSLTVPEGEIYIGHLSRSTTAGANASISQMLITNIASNFVGFFGQSHNTTQQWTQGQGVYTATTSAMPNSIAFSQLRGSDSLNFRAPAVMFINSTV